MLADGAERPTVCRKLLNVLSRDNPRKVLEAYKSRRQMEYLFAETKTRGFNMETSGSPTPTLSGIGS